MVQGKAWEKPDWEAEARLNHVVSVLRAVGGPPGWTRLLPGCLIPKEHLGGLHVSWGDSCSSGAPRHAYQPLYVGAQLPPPCRWQDKTIPRPGQRGK